MKQFTLLAIATLVCTALSAKDPNMFANGLIKYRIITDSTVAAAGSIEPLIEEASIPVEARNDDSRYSVVAIDSAAFAGLEHLHNVSIPTTVTTIGTAAFANIPLDTLTCCSETPYTIDTTVFSGSTGNIALFVPCTATEAYSTTEPWSTLFETIGNKPNVVVVLGKSGGTATGTGIYPCDTTVTFTATPNEGYRFTQWDDGNTDNPRTETITSNILLYALFEQIESGLTSTTSDKEASTVHKVIINGIIYIERNNTLYDISGRRIR